MKMVGVCLSADVGLNTLKTPQYARFRVDKGMPVAILWNHRTAMVWDSPTWRCTRRFLYAARFAPGPQRFHEHVFRLILASFRSRRGVSHFRWNRFRYITTNRVDGQARIDTSRMETIQTNGVS